LDEAHSRRLRWAHIHSVSNEQVHVQHDIGRVHGVVVCKASAFERLLHGHARAGCDRTWCVVPAVARLQLEKEILAASEVVIKSGSTQCAGGGRGSLRHAHIVCCSMPNVLERPYISNKASPSIGSARFAYNSPD
jgi:hypothetical protein